MIKSVIDNISALLRSSGVSEVYNAFDCIPVQNKGGKEGVFAVLSAGKLESAMPVYSEFTVFVPYETEVELNVLAPCSYGAYNLLSFFEEKIYPVLSAAENPSVAFRGITIGRDSNLNRLAMKIKLSASGISRLERSVSA